MIKKITGSMDPAILLPVFFCVYQVSIPTTFRTVPSTVK